MRRGREIAATLIAIAIAVVAAAPARASWKVTASQPTGGVPGWLAVDPAGVAYVPLFQGGSLTKINLTQHVLSHWTFQQTEPLGAAVDGDGQIVVSQGTPVARITVFDAAGHELRHWSTDGLGVSAVGADAQDHVFGLGGDMFEWGPHGLQLQQWGTASDGAVAVGAGGNLYVSDTAGGLVRKYSPSGFLIRSWSADHPSGIAVDTAGNTFVVSSLLDRVDEFGPHGHRIGGFPLDNLQYGEGIAVDAQERVYTERNGLLERWRLVRAQTTITSGPTGGGGTRDATPTYRFKASESGATFSCRVDGGAWKHCASPHTTAALAPGGHTFEVRATDAEGYVDRTPASASLEELGVAPAGA